MYEPISGQMMINDKGEFVKMPRKKKQVEEVVPEVKEEKIENGGEQKDEGREILSKILTVVLSTAESNICQSAELQALVNVLLNKNIITPEEFNTEYKALKGTHKKALDAIKSQKKEYSTDTEK